MDINKTISLSKQFCSDALNERLNIADDVVNNRFVFTLPWDMEATVEPVVFQGAIDWNFMPGDDCEWTVMLSRHRYVVCLAQAFAVTGKHEYLDTFIRLITDFIVRVPLKGSENGYTWRTLDSGIRCSNWVWALKIMEQTTTLPDTFLDLTVASLKEHIDYLLGCYDPTHLISNWGVLANTGALAACFYLQDKGLGNFQPQISLLLHRFDEQAAIQVLPDGFHWEQSPMYHHEVLWCFLETILLMKEHKQEISSTLCQKATAMCYATLYFAKPNHHQWMRCDSDDTDIRDILTLGAYLFRDGQLKHGGLPNLDFDNLWRLGGEAFEPYRELETIVPARISVAMEDSGNYFFRSSWQEDATMLAFKCGHLGSGHGHADLLHFDLFSNGEDVLMDCGRFTYVDNQDRRYLKSQAAHNTVTVDGKDFTDCCASWRFGVSAKPLKGAWYEDDQYYYVSGCHLGYMADGLMVRRQLVHIKPGIFLICDSLYGRGTHELTQKFHFNNAGKLSPASSEAVNYISSRNKLRLTSLYQDMNYTIEDACISRSYNQREISSSLSIKRTILADGGFITVIAMNEQWDTAVEKIPVYQPREQRVLDDHQALAVRLTGTFGSYTVIFSLNHPVGGINLLGAGEDLGFGEVMVFDSSHIRTVLAY